MLAKDVRQVLGYIETGNADAGVVYATDARQSGRVRVAAVAPPGTHAPVVYPVAVVRGSTPPCGGAGLHRISGGAGSAGHFHLPGFHGGAVNDFDFSPLRISLETAAAATVLTFVLGIAAARAMAGWHGRGRGLVDGILILPLVLPPTVAGFFLLLIFGRSSAVGRLLEHLGVSIVFSWPGTVVAATVVAFPLMYRTALGGFEQVSPNLLGAARTLGAGEWRTFRRVLLPAGAARHPGRHRAGLRPRPGRIRRHPDAGREHSGPDRDHAHRHLFRGRGG